MFVSLGRGPGRAVGDEVSRVLGPDEVGLRVRGGPQVHTQVQGFHRRTHRFSI